ncbi:5'/3'-nucleotidase SurE [Dactylosporangium siamense]|uniref:5'-nucleotidase n=1 Tax=Dactylosporangium siamense TaxID=685454 RepID=A0A919PIF9_9ACTN|nr:5'/3'-nucleotidase SurE [Dactylosporangium siamense]GIG44284.1 5'/3'-nucleotidase SurE [Dactylosporangium siamense]
MRILVTNDDGIDSPGLHALAAMAVRLGHDVVVAAPAREASGSGSSLTGVEADGRIATETRASMFAGVPTFAVSASPAFIALMATRGAYGPEPDVILSGINRGPNTGAAVLHSGTVGAAFTAAANGCRAMAVSLDIPFSSRSEEGAVEHWDTAAEVAGDLLPLLNADFVLNVNVPNLHAGDLRGIRRASLAQFGTVQMVLLEQGHGYVRMSLEQSDHGAEPGSDDAWLLDGYVAVTPVRPPHEARDVVLPGLVDTAGEHVGG